MAQQVRLSGPPRVCEGGVWHDAPLDKRLALLTYLAFDEQREASAVSVQALLRHNETEGDHQPP